MPIVLLTDFGLKDHDVGVMKGVISGIAPDAQVIDLTHGISPQDVRGAAVTLMQSVKYFPVGTIFCVAVDMGGAHRPVAVQAGGSMFVGPDNGVLSYALYNAPQTWAVDITHALDDGETDGQTVHGRDLIASVAALIHAGAPLETLGDPVQDMAGFEPPTFEIQDGWLSGEVLSIDASGSVVTSLGLFRWTDAETLSLRPMIGTGVWTVDAGAAIIEAGSGAIQGVRRGTGAVEKGQALAVIGSSGFLEIAVNQGSAAQAFALSIGQIVRVKIGEG